jgi:hypothetical protein
MGMWVRYAWTPTFGEPNTFTWLGKILAFLGNCIATSVIVAFWLLAYAFAIVPSFLVLVLAGTFLTLRALCIKGESLRNSARDLGEAVSITFEEVLPKKPEFWRGRDPA